METVCNRADTIPLLVVCGPTASGKTRLSIDLAKRFDGEVVSADSMQIYRGMDIGTAKPTEAEKNGVPHHMLDIVDPDKAFSLVDFLHRAKAVIADIHQRGKLPILAGGTGLYIHSLVDNIQFQQALSDPGLREKLEQEAREQGAEHLWAKLRDHDPELSERLHPNNLGRIIRALEVYALTGVPMSEWQRRSRREPSPYHPCMLGLAFENRQTLYDRIDTRVDRMLEAGLLDEVRALIAGGPLSKTAAQAIGYKELLDYLDARGSLDEAVALIKQSSRRYAKRQLTWLRRDPRIHWLIWESFNSYEELLEEAARQVHDKIN